MSTCCHAINLERKLEEEGKSAINWEINLSKIVMQNLFTLLLQCSHL